MTRPYNRVLSETRCPGMGFKISREKMMQAQADDLDSNLAIVSHFIMAFIILFIFIYYCDTSFIFFNWCKVYETDFISCNFNGPIIFPRFMSTPCALYVTHSGH